MSTSNFRIDEHLVPGQHIRQYPRATANHEDELKLAIKQYTPHDNTHPEAGDITLIAAHANGIGKELYEPLWDDLYLQSKRTGRFRIRSIWMADVAWQGWSSVVNEDKLGMDPSWFDHSRDLLHVINHFRAQMVRPLFGVGHSMGGNQIVNLSYMHPRLLTGIVLLDPVFQRNPTVMANYMPAYASTFRRDVWGSREEAASSMRKNAFYQTWDSRCLDKHIQYSLRELPTALHQTYTPREGSSPGSGAKAGEKPVTLTTMKHQEVHTFMRANFANEVSEEALQKHVADRRAVPDLVPTTIPSKPFYRPEPAMTFINLPHLRPRCLYLFGGESVVSLPELREDKMQVTGVSYGGNGGKNFENAVQGMVLEKAGHFFPFENPTKVAQIMNRWLGDELERWTAEEEAERKAWEKVKAEDGGKGRFVLSDEYVEWMKFDKKTKDDMLKASNRTKL